MKIRIKRLDPTIGLPLYGTDGAAAFDLAAAENCSIPPGAIALIGTGLVIEVPSGHFLAILARSSTPLKRGLMVANGVGVIDSDYSGPDDEVKIQVLNVTKKGVEIQKGDRIAQGVILPAPRIQWVEVSRLARTTRGGFGSTGD